MTGDNRVNSPRAAEFVQVLDDFGPRLRAVAAGMLGRTDEADEVCQDAFLTLWQNPPQHGERPALFVWLRRVVANLCIDRLRRRKAAVRGGEPTPAEPADRRGVDPARQVEATELTRLCREMIDGLSPDKRAVMSLRVLDELSYEEISQVLGCSIGTVMSRLHRARQELIERLRALGLAGGVETGGGPGTRRAAEG
jgi:RNA polymerase sigma-70 factor (ECF subfamily)